MRVLGAVNRPAHGVAPPRAQSACLSVPMPSISIVTTSPGFRKFRRLASGADAVRRAARDHVAGYSVRIDVRYRTMCASSQMKFFVSPSCFTTPFTLVTMWNEAGWRRTPSAR
jgi:hypothetical protein